MDRNAIRTIRHMASNAFIVNSVITQCGGIDRVAAHFGISRSAVKQWKKSGIPAVRVGSLVALADHKVSPSDLRPDIFSDVTLP
jgi:DNA-binding transcriptional regulator YdaS (Cro superfamily)